MKSKILIGGGFLAAALSFASVSAAQDAQAFADMAATSNMFEIQSSELALKNGQNDDVLAFAEQMVADHTAAGEKMQAAAEADGITPPTEMTDEQQRELADLQGVEGDGFDNAYVDAQVTAHDEAVALFESFSTEGEASALRDFAAETLPTLKEHQEHIHEMAAN